MYPLPYGRGTVSFRLPPSQPCNLITYRMEPNKSEDASTEPFDVIRQALDRPVGTPALKELALNKQSAVILISDGTRLCPSELLLPPLLQELNQGGIPDQAIDIVIALGLHRMHTREEMIRLVGEEVFARVRVHNHSSDAEDCIRLGLTSAGTPVEINRTVVDADLRIVTGNIEPHALAGISGGVKALVPGTASKRCIEHNHSLSLDDNAGIGSAGNRVHRDMEEALQFISVDFLLNVIVNHKREILEAVAGHVIDSHRTGIQRAAERFMVPVDPAYDITIVSPGGHPKDMHMYQAVKALRNASAITKSGGTILMAAECKEMYGNGLFQFWVETMKDRKRTAAKLDREFVLGPHKIAHLEEVFRRQKVYLLSEIPEPVVRLLGFEPMADLNSTLDQVLSQAHGTQSMACMPFGSLTFPLLP
ncbi:nickel-dependent lactate racemase [Paenibacillus rigui]|uniref:Uncharacterized protein n=1 Tax=Paenibacillus rigui TaxID=554312 RepID=A0A229UNQ0_9BACL|nr:nickel-dependent lactate racemase [Paenibacillus rigui]OXM85056.1 hypothetical protein CF651_17720 [Paenibacillus rigui]